MIVRLAQVQEDFLLELDVILEPLDALVVALVLPYGLLDAFLGQRLLPGEARLRFLCCLLGIVDVVYHRSFCRHRVD